MKLKRYTVTIKETVVYHVAVEAADPDDAHEIAVDTLLDADSKNDYFFGVFDREVTRITEANE